MNHEIESYPGEINKLKEKLTEMEFMFKSFEEYAEIMGITPNHPQWEAFKIIWDMARSPAWLLGDQE